MTDKLIIQRGQSFEFQVVFRDTGGSPIDITGAVVEVLENGIGEDNDLVGTIVDGPNGIAAWSIDKDITKDYRVSSNKFIRVRICLPPSAQYPNGQGVPPPALPVEVR